MRLWSLHPKYLDSKGLVALWREALLAQKVLRGKTKGYRYHPQLDRFKRHPYPVKAISTYLAGILEESMARGYDFDQRKICLGRTRTKVCVSRAELDEEQATLIEKLNKRDQKKHAEFASHKKKKLHPLMMVK